MSKTSTQNKRVGLTLPAELEKKIYALRKTDRYCRFSIAEIIRQLVEQSLAAQDHESQKGA